MKISSGTFCMKWGEMKKPEFITMRRHLHFSIFQAKRFAILVVLCLIYNNNPQVDAFSPLWDSVKTHVFQEYEVVSTRGQISVVRTRVTDIKKPDLVVGENVKLHSRLILTCTAWYPSEWVYSGDADPSYTSNSTIENLGPQGQILPLDDVNGAKRYVATIVIGPKGLKQSDTGRYNCMTASPETGMKFKTLSAFYHLFVPGKTLFIRKRGGTILYDLRKSPARIPCGVTNPKVAVSLQKFQNGNLINVDNETMLYHPISGFYPRQDIPGTYVCTAGHNKGMFELLHFTLVPKMVDSAIYQSIKQSSEEDLEWLFNSFKLGHPNRIRLSTRPPYTINSSDKRKPTRPPTKQSFGTPTSLWKRPSPEDHDDVLPSTNNKASTYRPVYVLFAEDLNRLKATTSARPRPSGGSGSGSVSASGSGSDEDTEEDEERENEAENEDNDNEQESSHSLSHEEEREKEPEHQYHYDPQHNNQDNSPILMHQLYSTPKPSFVPTTAASLRPSLHREYATTYLPFINFLNPGSAVIKYKPVVNPKESIISPYSERRTTTPQPPQGHIIYDITANKLVYHPNGISGVTTVSSSGFTRPSSERPTRTTSRPTLFKIPSLPTRRWVRPRPTTRPVRFRATPEPTTPEPPLIPDEVVCINSPCGKHATCYANTVYYHKLKETRREPACKCIEKYSGNPYLECLPPSPEESDFLSFNNTNLFSKRTGDGNHALEKGHLKNSEVFPSKHDDDDVIVDARKK